MSSSTSNTNTQAQPSISLLQILNIINLLTKSGVPLAERMAQETGGAIKPIEITEQEKKIVKENEHHGTRSSL